MTAEEAGLNEAGRPMRPGVSRDAVSRVLAEGGHLTRQEALRCRVRYFSDGLVLGSRNYVDDALRRHRPCFNPGHDRQAHSISGVDLGGLCTARRLRPSAIAQ